MSKRTRSYWQVTILALVSVCWLAPSARAQVRGTFTGSVSDPTGAIIPGATVTATNEGTGVATGRPTNSEGFYTIPDLQPGFYTMRAEAQGFKTFVNAHVELTVGYTQRVNFKLEVGAVTQSVTVEGQAPLVDTETDRLSELVTARQVANLPLNGRNVFQMIQLAPGAVSTTGVITEPGNRGFTTVVNGARVNMNGYYIDGISDKGLSGGSNTQPSLDTVQEFRVDTEVISAEYGSSVGSITTIVGKTGTNDTHGDLYEYVRNDKMDGKNYFEDKKTPFRMNQFGGTIGGPIKKNRWFYFASFEGERTRVSQSEQEVIETPAFRNFIITNAPNSVAALLFKNFAGPTPTSGITPLSTYIVNSGYCGALNAACLSSPNYNIDPTSPFGQAVLSNPDLPTFGTVNASAPLYSKDQFYNGNQFSGRIDWQGDHDKVFGRYFFDRYADPYYTPIFNGGAVAAFVGPRGFASPAHYDYPQLALGWSHTISANLLNEYHMGWNRNVTDFAQSDPGVPQIYADTGEIQFGGYNGYPQIFHEEVFHFSDIATYTRGRHTVKFGGEIARNYENSEFNVARGSYEFIDNLAFAAGNVEDVAVGVSPGNIVPATGLSTGQAHLASNIRAWRNIATGLFVNDDIKVSPRFTLTLGLRYDLYTRHTEKYGQATQFILPSGSNLTERLRADNCYLDVAGATGFDGKPCTGGFEVDKGALTTGDHNNFGPRLGFAWDMFGDGKTSLRGGFGVSYNGEVYNPLSNSRWDPPFYSFELAFCGFGSEENVTGPQYNDACIFGPLDGSAPTYKGPPTNPGAGPAGSTDKAFAGNIQGWNPYNANGAFLTGVVFPGFRDPYVYGSHFGLERQLPGNSVLKVSWVGTFGHKLYRSEDINRTFNGLGLGTGSGPAVLTGQCGAVGVAYRVNCLFGRIRTWEDSVNSNYDGLQVVFDKRMSHGLEWHTNYVWSHSMDERSTWHSGATTSSGAAEGFSMDQAIPGLDYGNSTFDIRHTFTNSFVWQMPWYQSQKGFAGHALGGWSLNNIINWHSGFPWTPYCSDSSFPSGTCDYNQDGVSNDRPNNPGLHPSNARSAFEGGLGHVTAAMFTDCSITPGPKCSNYAGPFDGNLGRNPYRGPSFADIDLSMFKNFKVSERVSLQFRAEAFNIANRVNLYLPNMRLGQATSLFGTSSQAYPARQIQFALKMMF